MKTDNRRHLLHVFSTFKIGGPQRRFADLVRHLGNHFNHSIISMDDRWEAWDLLPSKPSVTPIDFMADKGSSLKSIISARKLLKARQPDLLVTYNWGAIEWGAANLLPICGHVHIEDGFRPDEIYTRKKHRNIFRKIVLGKNSRVVIISETLRTIALQEWRLPRDRVQLIPNGIDIDRFCNPKLTLTRGELGLDEGDFVIGTIAALRSEKNIGGLVRAFSKIDQALNPKLVIGGSGPSRSEIEKIAADLDISEKMIFTGHVDAPETLYPVFDVFALSSQTEQMPLSILEAMAAKLPIASFNVGDVASMVSKENLPYVIEQSETKLTNALENLAQNPGTRDRLGEHNYTWARSKYSAHSMHSAYRQLFDA